MPFILVTNENFLTVYSGSVSPLVEQLDTFISLHPTVAVELIISDVSLSAMRNVPTVTSNRIVLDLDVAPHAQGLHEQRFDLIVSFQALGFTAHLGNTLAGMSSILVPGGVLLLGEVDGEAWTESKAGTLWYDILRHSFHLKY